MAKIILPGIMIVLMIDHIVDWLTIEVLRLHLKKNNINNPKKHEIKAYLKEIGRLKISGKSLN